MATLISVTVHENGNGSGQQSYSCCCEPLALSHRTCIHRLRIGLICLCFKPDIDISHDPDLLELTADIVFLCAAVAEPSPPASQSRARLDERD